MSMGNIWGVPPPKAFVELRGPACLRGKNLRKRSSRSRLQAAGFEVIYMEPAKPGAANGPKVGEDPRNKSKRPYHREV